MTELEVIDETIDVSATTTTPDQPETEKSIISTAVVVSQEMEPVEEVDKSVFNCDQPSNAMEQDTVAETVQNNTLEPVESSSKKETVVDEVSSNAVEPMSIRKSSRRRSATPSTVHPSSIVSQRTSTRRTIGMFYI
jgi:hypothetical protein